ncbi:hypothetical protein I553_4790 [Mycobacterium xenopi 4042]|uniref:Uncharacterized protein n=1 Tax=Mycobacterium xenopi 4042 TaxID=1299334 RepID=X8AHN2_MYCXE|nr:hypothetical protein I553_4790 [Mycobacterium xenopi 4042]
MEACANTFSESGRFNSFERVGRWGVDGDLILLWAGAPDDPLVTGSLGTRPT